jgi:hypothetical protein
MSSNIYKKYTQIKGAVHFPVFVFTITLSDMLWGRHEQIWEPVNLNWNRRAGGRAGGRADGHR